MMPRAYYNELDPFAAQWLRNLMAAGHIMAGEVDTRSIADVDAADLVGFQRVHFFAGIGGWDYALRLAEWPDDRPVWTGSCPCQPFSAAGKGLGDVDPRHLWPQMGRLIAAARPDTVMGEQVDAGVRHGWLDAVFADLERDGYACRAADLPAAGVGAPHIRQRIWWRADKLADANDAGLEGRRGMRGGSGQCAAGAGGVAGRLADADGGQCGRLADGEGRQRDGAATGRVQGDGRAAGGCDIERVGDTERRAAERHRHDMGGASSRMQGAPRQQRIWSDAGYAGAIDRPGPTNGVWQDADWVGCRDGRWRPVEPGSFPLADGLPGRVGRLRAYGNAIVPQVAAAFIAATERARP